MVKSFAFACDIFCAYIVVPTIREPLRVCKGFPAYTIRFRRLHCRRNSNIRHIRCAYAKDATQALYAYRRSSLWPCHVRKVAKKWSSHNNSLFGAFLRSHDDAMLHLKVMSRGFRGSCMPTVVHRSCTLSFLIQRRCHDHTQRGT
jgi:hypothetical protein